MQARSRLRCLEITFLDISSLRFAGVVEFDADSMTDYGIPLEKFKILRIALFCKDYNCSVCALVKA